MPKIIWDKTGERLYETGCDHGVLYPMQIGGVYNKGVAWNGLTAVTESPSGAEASPIYADNIKYVNLVSNEEFGATIEAYMYPDEFAECDGSVEIMPGMYAGQQSRKGVPRQLLQQDAQRIARALFEALAHDLHAVEEHGQAAKHGYDAENIHTYTPL